MENGVDGYYDGTQCRAGAEVSTSSYHEPKVSSFAFRFGEARGLLLKLKADRRTDPLDFFYVSINALRM